MDGLVQFVQTNGVFGEFPDWAGEMLAAKWMGVPPWEVNERSFKWTQRALLLRNLFPDGSSSSSSSGVAGQLVEEVK